jgi:rubredoxin
MYQIKPVCSNCQHIYDVNETTSSCRVIPGIIPKSCVDNLTCVGLKNKFIPQNKGECGNGKKLMEFYRN